MTRFVAHSRSQSALQIALAACCLCVCLSPGCTQQPQSLEQVKARTRDQYPDVNHVDPDQVARWVDSADANGGALILLDVRQFPEFAVSRLPGSMRVDPDAPADRVIEQALGDAPKDARIVTYCSVGVRSAAMARRLGDAGYTNVSNMNGSIFQWANEGRPLVRDGEAVDRVHPFDDDWGRLLDVERRAPIGE